MTEYCAVICNLLPESVTSAMVDDIRDGLRRHVIQHNYYFSYEHLLHGDDLKNENVFEYRSRAFVVLTGGELVNMFCVSDRENDGIPL